jgi:hypothetical protein
MKKLILEKSNAKLAVDLENNRQQSEILKQEKEKEIDRLKTNQKVHENVFHVLTIMLHIYRIYFYLNISTVLFYLFILI